MKERVLFVDDEPKILEAYRRTLRKAFVVVGAEGAKQAVEICKSQGPFPVVVSDMQMPEVNGVEFLSYIKKKYPDSMRIMLTGNADQQTAIDAINKGDVYCFLNKPCPPDKMAEAIKKALTVYRERKLEKELLEGTVVGCITTLVEILAMAKPQVFGRAQRIKDYTLTCASILGVEESWELETTALLSQIGFISLSDSLLEKILKGSPLTEEEVLLYQKQAKSAEKLILNIPRMEGVAKALSLLGENSDVKPDWPDSARILQPITALAAAESTGLSFGYAFALIESNSKQYDPDVMAALKEMSSSEVTGDVMEIRVSQLEPGMRLLQDIVTFSGALLVQKGYTMTPSLITRLANFAHSKEIEDKIKVQIIEEESD